MTWWVLAAYAVAICVVWPLRVRFGRFFAMPVAYAIGAAAACTPPVVGGIGVRLETWELIAAAAAGVVAGSWVLRVLGRAKYPILIATDFLFTVSLGALLYRQVPLPDGRSLEGHYVQWSGGLPWRSALAVAVVFLLAGSAATWLIALLRRLGVLQLEGTLSVFAPSDAEPALGRIDRINGEVSWRLSMMLTIAVYATDFAITVGLVRLGPVAIVLMAGPLILTRMGLFHEQEARQARMDSVAALARIPELTGYTGAGHAERVTELALRMGEELHFSLAQLRGLRDAGLLHDIGQVCLASRIPGGNTTDAAPSDQQAIAAESARILSGTHSASHAVVEMVREQATQFRVVQEGLGEVSVASRILKICNAFDDHSGGLPQLREVAIERITLGIGFEYDPELVELLIVVTDPRWVGADQSG